MLIDFLKVNSYVLNSLKYFLSWVKFCFARKFRSWKPKSKIERMLLFHLLFTQIVF